MSIDLYGCICIFVCYVFMCVSICLYSASFESLFLFSVCVGPHGLRGPMGGCADGAEVAAALSGLLYEAIAWADNSLTEKIHSNVKS
jgi:ABC-type multidrug transport system permease subunit